MADLSELIERVEKLTGPCRDADYRIEKELVRPAEFPASEIWPPFMVGSKLERSIPTYTASLDAAVALVERVLPGWKWAVSTDYDRHHLEYPCHAHVMERILPHPDADYNDFADGHGPTPAIALVRALLRALQAQEGRDG